MDQPPGSQRGPPLNPLEATPGSAPGADRSVDLHDWTAEERTAFDRERFRDERYRLLWVSITGAFVHPSFALLDWIVYPQYLRQLFIARLFGIAAILAGVVTMYFARTYWVAIAAFGGGFGAVALSVIYMGFIAGQASPYFAGAVLVQLFAAVLSGMPVWTMVMLNAIILAGYVLPLLWVSHLNVPALVTNLVLFLGASFASIVASVIRGRMARRQFLDRRQISRANAELQSLHQMKDQMFQNVSHEFRTPLTLILAPVERWIASPAELVGEAQVGLASIRRSALRLLNLINDLLDLARMGSAEVAGEALPLGATEDLRALLQRIATDVGPLAQSKGVAFEAHLPDVQLVYQVPARDLEKIVLNLLSNALKFTPAGGTVTLAAELSTGGALKISVSDTGIGVPPEAHARIFERFQQVDGGTTRRYGGTGIGLALVAELARRMNAELSLESTPGKGSTFAIELPAVARATANASESQAPLEHSVELARRAAYAALAPDIAHRDVREAGTRGPRILLAEDDPQLNAEIVRMLQGSYRLRSVSDGALALQEAQREPPDLLLSDVMMPGMDGVALAQALRQHPSLRGTAIVLLSARASLEDRVKGREVGVDTYLTKPFAPRELSATIEGLLRARMRVVGKYLVGRRLGEGAQCEVYQAEHLETGQVVALKMLAPHLAPDADGAHWLEREREALRRLSHPNIVRILEQGQQEQRFYMVMEYLEGQTLGAFVKAGGRFDAANVAAVGQALSRALSAVHGVGLVHRDVKRENILILETGSTLESRVKLIDFGVVLDTTRAPATAGETVGTLPNLAPELLKDGAASFASDQYATGVSLYQLITGRHPFQRGSRGETLAAILDAKPTPIGTLAPSTPQALIDIVERAMSPAPAARWPSMAVMAEALEKLAGGEGVRQSSVDFSTAVRYRFPKS